MAGLYLHLGIGQPVIQHQRLCLGAPVAIDGLLERREEPASRSPGYESRRDSASRTSSATPATTARA